LVWGYFLCLGSWFGLATAARSDARLRLEHARRILIREPAHDAV